jgi:hypothetical protein
MPYTSIPVVVSGLSGSSANVGENRSNAGSLGNALGGEPSYGAIGGVSGFGGGSSGFSGEVTGGTGDAGGGAGPGGQNSIQPVSYAYPTFPPPGPPPVPPPPSNLQPDPYVAAGGGTGQLPGNSMVAADVNNQVGTLLGNRLGLAIKTDC